MSANPLRSLFLQSIENVLGSGSSYSFRCLERSQQRSEYATVERYSGDDQHRVFPVVDVQKILAKRCKHEAADTSPAQSNASRCSTTLLGVIADRNNVRKIEKSQTGTCKSSSNQVIVSKRSCSQVHFSFCQTRVLLEHSKSETLPPNQTDYRAIKKKHYSRDVIYHPTFSTVPSSRVSAVGLESMESSRRLRTTMNEKDSPPMIP